MVTFGAGLLHRRWTDLPGPLYSDLPTLDRLLASVGCLVLIALIAGWWLYRQNARRFGLSNLLFVLWLPLTLVLLEGTFRSSVPAWPARVLHGVDPEVGREAWASGQSPNSVMIN